MEVSVTLENINIEKVDQSDKRYATTYTLSKTSIVSDA